MLFFNTRAEEQIQPFISLSSGRTYMILNNKKKVLDKAQVVTFLFSSSLDEMKMEKILHINGEQAS